MGNSTRCHAVIQHLKDRNAIVDVVSSGNGIWYFQNNKEINNFYEIESFKYGSKDGQISIFRTLKLIPEYIRISKRNKQTIQSIVAEHKPDAIVTDSVYYFGTLRKYVIPIVSLNNADVVFSGYFQFSGKPLSILPQFLAVECMDFLIHRFFADLVISPLLDKSLPHWEKVFRVGPVPEL